MYCWNYFSKKRCSFSFIIYVFINFLFITMESCKNNFRLFFILLLSLILFNLSNRTSTWLVFQFGSHTILALLHPFFLFCFLVCLFQALPQLITPQDTSGSFYNFPTQALKSSMSPGNFNPFCAILIPSAIWNGKLGD